MLLQTGTGTEVRGQLSGTSLLGLGGASGKGRCMAVGLQATGLNLLGAALFLFSVTLFFLMLGLVSGSGGLNWLAEAGPILPSTSKKGFHFRNDCGVRVKSCAPWCTLDCLYCLVSSKYMSSLHGRDFHFHIHHFYWEFASKETMQEVSLVLK